MTLRAKMALALAALVASGDVVITPANSDNTPDLSKILAISAFQPDKTSGAEMGGPGALAVRSGVYLVTLSAPKTISQKKHLDAAQAGLLSVVVSASTEASALGHDELVAAISLQLTEALGKPLLKQPLWNKVITEKRATFACTPGLQRPSNQTAQAGLWLAGDYTESDYPATIEGAVRSGLQAAYLCCKDAGFQLSLERR